MVKLLREDFSSSITSDVDLQIYVLMLNLKFEMIMNLKIHYVFYPFDHIWNYDLQIDVLMFNLKFDMLSNGRVETGEGI